MKKISALFVTALLMALAITVIAPVAVSASIPAARRGIGFVRMYTANPGALWNGFDQASNIWIDIDVTQEGLHTLSLPAWPQTSSNWTNNGNTSVFFLLPSPLPTGAHPVSIESITIAGEERIGRRTFGSGGFWNNPPGTSTYFGNVSVPNGQVNSIPGFTIRQWALPDISPSVTVDNYSSAGPSATMGSITAGQVVAVTFRVGAPPITPPVQQGEWGHVRGQPHITGADITLLRRFLAQPADARVAWGTANGVNLLNADVNGDGSINNADLTLLRQYISGVPVRLGPAPQGWFISITTDDGPTGGTTSGDANPTATMLNHLQALNTRPHVVCGMNGVYPCPVGRPGRHGSCVRNGGASCGTQSRAHISFYVMNAPPAITGHYPIGVPRADSVTLMRRMIQEGHSIENHTMTHTMSTGQERSYLVNSQINPLDTQIRNVLHGTGPITDLYGRTWNSSNPYTPFSFRPSQFTIGAGMRGTDTETNKPWIFAGLDLDDWRGHGAQHMFDFMMNGAFDRCPHGCAGCSISSWSSYAGPEDGGANGGIILIHDNPTAGARAAELVRLLIPPMQELGYHFVTIEDMFYYLDAEWAWMHNAGTITSGQGNGTRLNDWVVPGARRNQAGGAPRPDIVRGGNYVPSN
jgi:hypothetical protein